MTSETKNILLIVDDDPTNIEIIANLFDKEYKILVAPNGEKALEIVADRLPDLILLDIEMPGIDGYEVCRRLKADAALNHVPILFITVKESDEFEKQGLELGAADYITKPFNPVLLRLRIQNNMNLKLQRDMIAQQLAELTDLNLKLQAEMDEVKMLRGMLPICCVCKKIRNDTGYWEQIESYFMAHSELLFSHGFCPECAEEIQDSWD